jgi:hypothetical protein
MHPFPHASLHLDQSMGHFSNPGVVSFFFSIPHKHSHYMLMSISRFNSLFGIGMGIVSVLFLLEITLKNLTNYYHTLDLYPQSPSHLPGLPSAEG